MYHGIVHLEASGKGLNVAIDTVRVVGVFVFNYHGVGIEQ